MCLYHFSGTYALYFIIAWLPLYLVKVRGYDIADMVLLTALFYAGQTVGAAGSAAMADRLIARGVESARVRRVVGLVCSAFSVIGVLAIGQTETTDLADRLAGADKPVLRHHHRHSVHRRPDAGRAGVGGALGGGAERLWQPRRHHRAGDHRGDCRFGGLWADLHADGGDHCLWGDGLCGGRAEAGAAGVEGGA